MELPPSNPSPNEFEIEPSNAEHQDKIALSGDEIQKLIQLGWGDKLADDFERIECAISHDELVERLLEAGNAEAVMNNLEKFANLSTPHDELAERLMDSGYEDALLRNLEKLTHLSLSQDALVDRLIAAGKADAVLSNLEKLTDLSLSHDDLAQKVLDTGQQSALLKNLRKLTHTTNGMDQRIVQWKPFKK